MGPLSVGWGGPCRPRWPPQRRRCCACVSSAHSCSRATVSRYVCRRPRVACSPSSRCTSARSSARMWPARCGSTRRTSARTPTSAPRFGVCAGTAGSWSTASDPRSKLGGEVAIDLHESRRIAREVLAGSPLPADISTHLAVLAVDVLPDWYEDWVMFERECHRQLRLHALEALCEQLAAADRTDEALEAGLTAVAGEPLRESGYRQRSCGARGRRERRRGGSPHRPQRGSSSVARHRALAPHSGAIPALGVPETRGDVAGTVRTRSGDAHRALFVPWLWMIGRRF